MTETPRVAGAAVALVARSQTQLTETAAGIGQAGGRALPLVANVSNAAAVRQAVREATRVLRPITLLVNNAGSPGPFGRNWEVDADAWCECIEVSVRGAFICNQVVVPDMIARGGGVEYLHTGGVRTLDDTRRKLDALRRHCASAGRPYEAILKSHIGLPVVVGESAAALEAKLEAQFGAVPADRAALHRTSMSRGHRKI